MKRALPMLAALLVLAGVIAFTNRRVGVVGERFPAARAAELAPADALAFVAVPDIDRTLERWEQLSVQPAVEMSKRQGREWREFWPAWIRSMKQDPQLALFFQFLPAWNRVSPSGAFLAVTNFEADPLPKFVVGFPCRGKRTDVEHLVRMVKEQLFASWPGAISELSQHHGIEIETIRSITGQVPLGQTTMGPPAAASIEVHYSPSRGLAPVWPTPGIIEPPAAASTTGLLYPEVDLAYRDDWLFFSTDRALLAETLERYLGKPGAPRSLAADPDFAACRKCELPEADGVAWQRWDAGVLPVADDSFEALEVLWEQRRDSLQAMHFSVKLEGPIRDRLYFHRSGNRLAPASPPREMEDFKFGDGPFSGPFPRQTQGFLFAVSLLGEEDLKAAFAPEVSFIHQAERADFVVALEVRDGVKAHAFAEKIAHGRADLRISAEGENTRWDWVSFSGPSFRGPLVLTKTHLLVGADFPERLWGRLDQEQPRNTFPLGAPVQAMDIPAAAYFYPDVSNFFQQTGLPLPWFARRYWPAVAWGFHQTNLLPRDQKPGAFQLRQEGQGWLVESDLHVNGRHLFNQWLGHER